MTGPIAVPPADTGLLLGPAEGWSLAPVVAWLMTEGRRMRAPEALAAGLGQALVQAGAPVARLQFGVRTLHPQIRAWVALWEGAGAAIRTHGFHSDHYAGSPIEQVHLSGATCRRRLHDVGDGDHRLVQHLAAERLSDVVFLPMLFHDGEVNVVALATRAPAGFTDGDIARFEALSRHLAPIVEILERERIAATVLDTYVGHRTGGRILRGQIRRGDLDRIHAVVWYSDLRNFTQLGERLPPEALIALLNAYFEAIAAATAAQGGEILQFIGDAALIIFECDEAEAGRAANGAVEAALDAFAAVDVVNRRRQRGQEAPIEFGVGLHVGPVLHGNIGSPDRLGFNVVGPAVNRTARLESLTKAAGVPLLLSAELAALLSRPVRQLGRFAMKGITGDQAVFALAD